MLRPSLIDVGANVKGFFDDQAWIHGQLRTQEVSKPALVEYLDVLNEPIFYEDTVLWPEQLRERL